MKLMAPALLAYALIYSLTMACFTDPQGFPVWIVKEQIVSVSRNVDGNTSAQTKVTTSSGAVYVRERPEDVAKSIGQ